MDIRLKRYAETIVQYSAYIQPKEVVLLRGTPACQPALVALYEAVLKQGGMPIMQMIPDVCHEMLLKYGHDFVFDEPNAYDLAAYDGVDVRIHILSSENTRGLTSADSEKQGRMSRSSSRIRQKMSDKKWVISLFPTAAYAQDADMSLREFEDFVYSACFCDEEDPVAAWKALGAYQDRLIASLEGAEHVRVLGEDTDLSFSIAGRTFINSAGTRNFPSGEIFTGPIEDSANGHIRYDFPVCHGGREIEGIRLVFENGEVVEATAEKNQDFLLSQLNLDPGARRLGELGIGTNQRIQRFTKNILFDEKIGGTVHLALGNSYPETGATNQSTLHWDMIKDLRSEGQLLIDGQPINMDV